MYMTNKEFFFTERYSWEHIGFLSELYNFLFYYDHSWRYGASKLAYQVKKKYYDFQICLPYMSYELVVLVAGVNFGPPLTYIM